MMNQLWNMISVTMWQSILGGDIYFILFVIIFPREIKQITLRSHCCNKDTLVFLQCLPVFGLNEVIIIHQLQWSWKGFHLVRPSVHPSIHPSVCLSICLGMELCSLCIFHNTCQIHFIFTHLINQLEKVCGVLSFLWKLKISMFAQCCYFRLLDPWPWIVYIFHRLGDILDYFVISLIWAPSQYKDRLIYVWRFPC